MPRHSDAVVSAVIDGLAGACRANSCALIGGEMAELPDVYHPGEYDLAGVIIGVVGEGDIIDGSRVREGDVILGLASTGLHTNGYTLARKLVFQTAGLTIDDEIPGADMTVADALLAVHRPYGRAVLPLAGDPAIHALAHITGGGFPGNVNRTLPDTLDALIDIDTWKTPPLFQFLVETGGLSEREGYRTFNMGVGMTITVAAGSAEAIAGKLREAGETVYRIGRIASGTGEVRLVHSV